MNDGDALLAAICASPAEDVPRLMYADWLEENDQPERAEFIRLQVELVKSGCPCDKCRNWGSASREGCLIEREQELLAAHETNWRAVGKCPECKEGKLYWPGRQARFGGEVTDCPHCHGTDDRGGLLRKFMYGSDTDRSLGPPELVRAEWHRGFIDRVEVPQESDLVAGVITCSDCGDSKSPHGRQYCYKCNSVNLERQSVPTQWFRDLLTASPERRLIREVMPLDRVPYRVRGSNHWRWWAYLDESNILDEHRNSVLPIPVYGILRTQHSDTTREAAIAAAGRAFATWARNYIATNSQSPSKA